MPGVTKEQIEAAKQISAIQFLRRCRPGQLEKDAARGELHLKDHDSFKISEATSLWHWKSRDVGGTLRLGLPHQGGGAGLCGGGPAAL